MMMQLTGLIKKQGKLYSAICLELDVASQGKTPEEAAKNLKEAIFLYLEDADKDIKAFRRHAPYKLWREYYQAATNHVVEEVKRSHHLKAPKIDLRDVQVA
jgi:predicted RNase H-like HicB family nuclease